MTRIYIFLILATLVTSSCSTTQPAVTEQPPVTTAVASEPEAIISRPAPRPRLDPAKERILDDLQRVNDKLEAVKKMGERVANIDPDTKNKDDITLRDNWNSFVTHRKEYTDGLENQKAYLELKRDDLLVPDKYVVLPVETKINISETAIRHLTKKHEWNNRHTRIYLSTPDEFSEKLIKRFAGSEFPVELPPRLGMANSLKVSIGDINPIKRNRILIKIVVGQISPVRGTHDLIFKKDGDKWILELDAWLK